VDVEVSRDPITGRRRRVSRTVVGTREEAEIALARLKVADHERRLPVGGTSARSVRAAFQLYQQTVDAGLIDLSPSTKVTVRSAVRTMSSTLLGDGQAFGDVRLSRLTWQDIEEMYAAMRATGRGTDWVRRCATVLNRSLELARKRGLLDTNPAKDATRPRSTRKKPFAPMGKEVLALLVSSRSRDPEIADVVTLLASSGLRVGELLALRWEDVDLEAGELHVSAAITDGGRGVGVIRKPTKRSDWRDVPLTSSAAEAFRSQRRRRRELVGADPGANGYVFPGGPNDSVPLRPDRLGDRWAAARGPSSVTLQHLRHYAATAMLDAGESYRTVAEILGNSESTLRLHYDGRTDVGKRRAIAALELGSRTDRDR
jgi:integrase